jgi:protein SCO1/2
MGSGQQGRTEFPGVDADRDSRRVGQIGRRRWLRCIAAMGGVGAMRHVLAGDAAPEHDHSAHKALMAAAAAPSSIRRRQASYQAPAVTMLDQRGRKVAFDAALDDGRPVILNFIFTSCTTICPVMTQIFSQVQSRLSGELDKVHMVSVSIDPEYDTPARLLAYTRQYGAGPQWDFYTGSVEASTQVQKAFDAYRGDKMNHEALVLLRGRRGTPWLRLDGFASADAIVDAYRSIAS